MISTIIHTKNSAATLKRALESVKWADEIVVIDMHSTDETVQIAEKYTDRIFSFKDVGYVEPARNFGISKAKGEWILILDADEEVLATLKKCIQQVHDGTISPELRADAYAIPRKNLVFGEWMKYAGWWPDYQIRLFRSGQLHWPEDIHQVPKVKGKLLQLPPEEELAIIHQNYADVSSFIQRLDRYTTHEVTRRGPRATSDVEIFRAFTTEFVSRYFKHEGIKGGALGTGISLMQSMYEVSVLLKQAEAGSGITTRPHHAQMFAELRNFQKDVNYWIADWHVQQHIGFSRLSWMIRRKFRL